MTSKTPKKALARATFLAHARFERSGAKSVFWGGKVRQNSCFRSFRAKIAKMAPLECKIESSIEIIEIPLRL